MTTTPNDGRGAWRKFICLACGYVYDEEFGDPDGGLPAGTRFHDIADDWQCPLCGVRKSDFEPYDESANVTPTIVFDRNERGVVIIGGGLAGWAVVDAIRATDKDILITLISADSADRYHKPMLSVAISQGKRRAELVRTTGEQCAKDNSLRLLAHTYVTDINPQEKTLHTTRGTVLYDKLVMAIGASPAYPPTIPQDLAWHINNLERFEGLQARLNTPPNTPKNIAIIGAGMIGTEIAEDLIKAGHEVGLIDVSPYPLSALLPKVAGERILQAIKTLGVNWLGYSMVKGVQATPNGYEITLFDCDGESESLLYFDEIIVATGLSVSERLPVRAGLTFNQRTGIAVNPDTLQTSNPHIYALGDCISIDGVPCRYVAPHRAQASVIAGQILQKGEQGAIYKHTPPMIRLKNKCISVSANGLPKGGGDWQIVSDEGGELIIQMSEHGQVVAKATIKSV